jgi:hypothetical protein
MLSSKSEPRTGRRTRGTTDGEGDEGTEVAGMEFTAHQWPYCELRFALRNEVRDHIRSDHPVHESTAEER